MTNTDTLIPSHCEVTLSDDPKYMTVWFSWGTLHTDLTLDRPISQGMSCLPRHVPRLIRAFLEGALFDGPLADRAGGPRIAVDVNGGTYAGATCKVHGKYLNRDLTALGF